MFVMYIRYTLLTVTIRCAHIHGFVLHTFQHEILGYTEGQLNLLSLEQRLLQLASERCNGEDLTQGVFYCLGIPLSNGKWIVR